MMYARYSLSLCQAEDLLFERSIDLCNETVRFWWNWFDPMFAPEIRKHRLPICRCSVKVASGPRNQLGPAAVLRDEGGVIVLGRGLDGGPGADQVDGLH